MNAALDKAVMNIYKLKLNPLSFRTKYKTFPPPHNLTLAINHVSGTDLTQPGTTPTVPIIFTWV